MIVALKKTPVAPRHWKPPERPGIENLTTRTVPEGVDWGANVVGPETPDDVEEITGVVLTAELDELVNC